MDLAEQHRRHGGEGPCHGETFEQPTAMDLAEQHPRHIGTWFYDVDHTMHVSVAGLYVSDPRFRQGYEDVAPGLAQYVHDAIVANAARHG